MYAKVFEQIFDSSLAENPQVRWVFMDMLVLADRHGIVDLTPEAISRRTNVPLETVLACISSLEGEDHRSRSPDCGGARIVRLDTHRDWGWQIVNHAKYREMKTEFDRTEYMREYMRKKRGCKTKKLTKTNSVNVLNSPVSVSASESASSLKGGTGGKFQRPTQDQVRLFCAKAGISESDADWFWNKMEGNGWTNGGKPVRNWERTLTAWNIAGYLASQKLASQKGSLSAHPRKQTMEEITRECLG